MFSVNQLKNRDATECLEKAKSETTAMKGINKEKRMEQIVETEKIAVAK